MASESIDIVMFNMSAYTDWQNGIANRNMYVLHALLADSRVRKVIAVDYLPFTLRRAVRQWFQNVATGVQGQVISRSAWHKLTALRESEIERTGFAVPGTDPDAVQHKLYVYSDIRSVRSETKLYAQLKQELDRLNCKNIVLWSYLPTFAGYFGSLGERLSVFDAVDNWLEHSAYTKIRDRLKLNYETIRSRADIVFTTATDLSKLFDRPENCFFIPNGVDMASLQQAPKLVGRDVAALPRPIIGYIGTIQEDRVDVDLVAYLAKQNPQKSFVLIGGVWPGLRREVQQKLKVLPNVYLVGRKSFRETPGYLREFAVAIIPHRQNEFNRHTNPMKLYEYLAAGKPIVATPGAGLSEFKSVVRIAKTPEEFNRALIQALLDTSPEAAEARKVIAAEQAWEKRVQHMLEIIMAKLASNSGPNLE